MEEEFALLLACSDRKAIPLLTTDWPFSFSKLANYQRFMRPKGARLECGVLVSGGVGGRAPVPSPSPRSAGKMDEMGNPDPSDGSSKADGMCG